MKTIKTFFALSALIAIFAFAAPPGNAQVAEPELMVSWRAESYVPPRFSGKALPPPNAPIVASFEVVEGGAAQNISQEIVYWYVDGVLVKSGAGVRAAVFTSARVAGSKQSVRVQIDNYKNRGEVLVKTIEIPTLAPEAVIETPFPGGAVTQRSVPLRGAPYYFTIKDPGRLLFRWNVNGQSPEDIENPQTLYVNLEGVSERTPLVVSFTIENPFRDERAGSRAELLFEP